ncbi:aspartate aminotransferase family protein (plasmid) [Gemmobacter fulvus]|uniref:Aspartate aminotransferase family protein n=1 Tax=Gemmobacter fulvus TaxID=2840474 RepID=A0A975PBA8_9RHOB|nr:aspartate aminotransferase family protein [Gemmobacter fulvus]MBT9247731.1 aspartate aminotransferase family protein [Gemmobacter fulvus]QWK92910.1 aspartate aminotransferase family protein [Gemmobacter fulvus]
MTGLKSQQLFERGRKVLIEGVSSASRGPSTFGGAPRYMSHGQGARLYDVDGNSYIDWMMAFGALPLGHAHPAVVETVAREVAGGTHFATALQVEVEVAEMLVDLLPHVEKVRFANTGTEAAMAAIRLARGHTGRRKIIKFEGHYHGWWDAVLLNTNPLPPTMFGHPNDPIRIPDSSGIPEEAWRDTIVVRWNDVEALERAMAIHGREAACLVTEGIMSNMGVIPPKPGYLLRMQDLCREYGALFYLDETVTGFRVAAGGCAELYGLDPDIVTYGKALGGGLPMAMIGGRNEVMSGLEWGKVLHYGTHNAGRLALSVTKVMLQTLLANDRAGFSVLRDRGLKMAEAFRTVARASNRHGVICQGVNSMFQIFFTDREVISDFREFCTHVDRLKFRDFTLRLMDKGIYMNPSATLHSLSSLAHSDADIAATAKAMAEVLDEMP